MKSWVVCTTTFLFRTLKISCFFEKKKQLTTNDKHVSIHW